VFQKIAQAALRHYGVAPTINAPPPVMVSRRMEEFHPASTRETASLVPAEQVNGARELPDLRGLSAREALRVLTRFGLAARLTGNGVVIAQKPAPGSVIDAGAICELRLDRAPEVTAVVAGDLESATR
jgi:hypothetical protein